MLVYDPGATPLDLNFRIFGIQVRVHPLFWLIMLIFGWRGGGGFLPGNGLGDALVFVACAFVSILLHELGHVWMGQIFGTRGHILLHGMGGLAIGSADVPHSWQRILVSAAGPGIQLLFYGALQYLIYMGVFSFLLTPAPGGGGLSLGQKILVTFLVQLLWINWFWPLLNLLPIWPLDGGWITREICQMASSRRGLLASLWISLVAAVALAINAIYGEMQHRVLIPYVGRYFLGMFLAFFFAMFAFGSWQAIQAETQRQRRFWDDELPWER